MSQLKYSNRWKEALTFNHAHDSNAKHTVLSQGDITIQRNQTINIEITNTIQESKSKISLGLHHPKFMISFNF